MKYFVFHLMGLAMLFVLGVVNSSWADPPPPPIPEPSTFVLFAVAAAGVGGYAAWKKRRNNK